MLHRLPCCRLSGDLCGIRGALAGTFESLSTSTTPRDNVTIGVSKGHNCVIKGGLEMGLPTRNGLTFTPPWFACWFLFVSCCHTLQFLPALLLSYGSFLASDCSLWSTARTCVGTRALAANWQVTAMAHTTITTDFDQPFDVQIHFAAQIPLDFV